MAIVDSFMLGLIAFLKLDRPLCGSVCLGLLDLLGVPMYVSAGWLRAAGIAIFIGTAAAPAPGAPGAGGCPPVLYTVGFWVSWLWWSYKYDVLPAVDT